ncbi:MAG: hypothetical protein ACAI25_01385 [Planctomycetota bacterium]
MTPEAEKELAKLATLGVTDKPDPPPRHDAHGFLLAVESLVLTLDDNKLRADALLALALARKERGEEERALELVAMAKRAADLPASPSRSTDYASWIRSVLAQGEAFPISLVANAGERPRTALLLTFASRILGSTCADGARELARDLIASDDTLVATGAIHALAALEGLGPREGAAARERLVRSELKSFALDALVKAGRVAGLENTDTGDMGANALVGLACMRLAAEKGDVARGRELFGPVSRSVLELRVKRRNGEATEVFTHLLPLAAALHPEGASLLESLVEDPVLAWGYPSAALALESYAAASAKLATLGPALASLEQNARLALRRIRHSDEPKKAVRLFPGLAACARAAALLGDPAPLCERISGGAREKLVKETGLFARSAPCDEYRALLGCGEALARKGDAAALQGAIAALVEAPSEAMPLLLDDALSSAEEVEAVSISLEVLELARHRLDEAPVAHWLAELALRAGELVGPRPVLARWRRAEERRLRARFAAPTG